MRKAKRGLTRRDILQRSVGSVAAGALLAAPYFGPSTVLADDKRPAPSGRITLGVIGIGPRCTYDLKAMLKLPDVQCVAICDVQASRREAGKKLVDEHYGNKDCAVYRDFRELLGRTRHRRRPDRHRRPLARPGVDAWRRRPARTSTARSPAASPSPIARR